MLMLTMSRFLSELLGAREPMFTLALRQLEQASNVPRADIHLQTDIEGKVRQKTKELGLDPKDSTGKELYHALISLAKKHDEFLVSSIGGSNPTDVADLMPRMKNAVEKLNIPRKTWAIRHSVAKRLLGQNPPRSIMKQLGYRSIDSMLKREPILEIYGAIRFAESPTWLEKFIQSYRKLRPGDFETRDIEIVILDANKWGQLANAYVHNRRHNVAHLKELGVVLVLPLPVTKLQGICLAGLPLLLHYMNEIRLYSTFFKFQQVKVNFGEILIDTLLADPPAAVVMGDQSIHWRVVQRYFGKSEQAHHPEIFEPHVQPEDLIWRQAEDVLYQLEPALSFWKDLDYVGMDFKGKIVSFNLRDVAVSYCNQLPYGQQSIFHLQASLWNEIFIRYMGQESLERQVLKQLDSEVLSPELFVKASQSKGKVR